jgi:hypothetical protein
VGEPVGILTDGECVGDTEGDSVGSIVGRRDGVVLGPCVGEHVTPQHVVPQPLKTILRVLSGTAQQASLVQIEPKRSGEQDGELVGLTVGYKVGKLILGESVGV